MSSVIATAETEVATAETEVVTAKTEVATAGTEDVASLIDILKSELPVNGIQVINAAINGLLKTAVVECKCPSSENTIMVLFNFKNTRIMVGLTHYYIGENDENKNTLKIPQDFQSFRSSNDLITTIVSLMKRL